MWVKQINLQNYKCDQNKKGILAVILLYLILEAEFKIMLENTCLNSHHFYLLSWPVSQQTLKAFTTLNDTYMLSVWTIFIGI